MPSMRVEKGGIALYWYGGPMVFNIGDIPRTARVSVARMWYHVLNRGNRREPVFHKPGDYDAFVEAMTDAGTRVRIDLLGYCLMPNHFQLEVVELAQMAAATSGFVERRGAGPRQALAGAGQRATLSRGPQTIAVLGIARPAIWKRVMDPRDSNPPRAGVVLGFARAATEGRQIKALCPLFRPDRMHKSRDARRESSCRPSPGSRTGRRGHKNAQSSAKHHGPQSSVRTAGWQISGRARRRNR
jgi:hypothetical protein